MQLSLQQQQKIEEICRQSGIIFLGLFGSQARGEASDTSDVDLLVRYLPLSPIRSLLDHVGVQLQISDLLGREVDLVDERSLKPAIKPYVLRDLKPLYERS